MGPFQQDDAATKGSAAHVRRHVDARNFDLQAKFRVERWAEFGGRRACRRIGSRQLRTRAVSLDAHGPRTGRSGTFEHLQLPRHQPLPLRRRRRSATRTSRRRVVAGGFRIAGNGQFHRNGTAPESAIFMMRSSVLHRCTACAVHSESESRKTKGTGPDMISCYSGTSGPGSATPGKGAAAACCPSNSSR